MPNDTGQIKNSANAELARQQQQQAQASRKKASASANASADKEVSTAQRTDKFLRDIQQDNARREVQHRQMAAERQQIEEQRRRVQEMNQRLQEFDVQASVRVHQPTKSRVIQVRDRDTNTLLDQVPSDLYLRRKMDRAREIRGRVIDKKA